MKEENFRYEVIRIMIETAIEFFIIIVIGSIGIMILTAIFSQF